MSRFRVRVGMRGICFYAVGDGAVGFANFGLDRVHLDEPLSAEMIAQIEGFRLLGSFDRELAALMFAGKVQTAVEENGIAQRELALGSWQGGGVVSSGV